jgi:hypothetical protein
MKILFALIATLVATVSSTEDKPAALPLLPYAYPHAYGGVPFLGSAPLAYAVPSGAAAPLSYAPNFVGSAAVLAPVPAPPLSHVHQAQDEFGNTNYGYVNLNSAKQEIGNGHVGVTGSYQYVDANNQLQTVNYVADALGFRVADSRLPVAPTYDGVAPVGPVYDGVAPVAPVYDGVAPEPVKDTPEVIAARAEHLAAFEKVAAEHSVKKREAMHNTYAVMGYNYLPYKYGSGFYTRSLADHRYRYPYVVGYGPRAYSYFHRGY